MKKCLVIGASGLVGEHLVNSIQEAGGTPIATYLSNPIPDARQLDVSDNVRVNDFLKTTRPDIVFLPAALTNVDFCEKNPDISHRINVTGVKNVVNASNEIAARTVYFSTDYIFDGTSGPYAENADPNPISEYGKQKLEAENYILSTSNDHLIIRTTVVYGWERQGKNFVSRLVKSLQDQTSVKVPADQIGTPTYAPELAKSALKLALMNSKGVINIAGIDCISRYKFALKVASAFDLPSDLILPVSTRELNQPAPRPLLAGLKTEKAARLLNTNFLESKKGLTMMAKQISNQDILST